MREVQQYQLAQDFIDRHKNFFIKYTKYNFVPKYNLDYTIKWMHVALNVYITMV